MLGCGGAPKVQGFPVNSVSGHIDSPGGRVMLCMAVLWRVGVTFVSVPLIGPPLAGPHASSWDRFTGCPLRTRQWGPSSPRDQGEAEPLPAPLLGARALPRCPFRRGETPAEAAAPSPLCSWGGVSAPCLFWGRGSRLLRPQEGGRRSLHASPEGKDGGGGRQTRSGACLQVPDLQVSLRPTVGQVWGVSWSWTPLYPSGARPRTPTAALRCC